MAAGLPLDEPAQLLCEAIDQPTAQSGIAASRIDPAAVIGHRQAKAARAAVERHHDRAARLARERILDGVHYELVDDEPDRDRLPGG